MTKTKAKREPTYLLDCVLPPTDVTADGFLAKHKCFFRVTAKGVVVRDYGRRSGLCNFAQKIVLSRCVMLGHREFYVESHVPNR